MRRLAPSIVALLSGCMASVSLGGDPAAPDRSLAAQLQAFDKVRLLRDDDRPPPSQFVASDVRRRLRAASSASTAAWRALHSRADWEAFRQEPLAQLRESLGQFPPRPTAVTVRLSKTQSRDGFAVDNVLYESRPGLWVSANLYRPAAESRSAPGIVICHSHHTPKTHGELQDMGMTWARLGCYVLVPDQIGHGERRQHPFRSDADFAGSFRVSRQDYFFRYDLAVQAHLAGGSLIGQMVWDLERAVDVLLAQPGIDARRIALLGSVAGGGDPAAVTAALDSRITVAVPFNFGGPQPETRFPLPDDAEDAFDYTGSGGWESTRNLRQSAAGGFLPWVIVGGIAPRRLIYAHEFAWDRERDPVWKRLETIYGFYDGAGDLAFTLGRGSVGGQPPESTHCTHIGLEHRRLIHGALSRWWELPDAASREFSQRLPADSLLCWTPELVDELRPRHLRDILRGLVAKSARIRQSQLAAMTPDARRQTLQAAWKELAGDSSPPEMAAADRPTPQRVATLRTADAGHAAEVDVYHWVPKFARELPVPTLLLVPADVERPAVVVGFAPSGKPPFLRRHAATIATLLGQGVAVCLTDLRGMGETRPGDDRSRTSATTDVSSSALMLGAPLVNEQLQDLRGVLRELRNLALVDGKRLALWGDSGVDPTAADSQFVMPHGVDGRPREAEPAGGLLALLAAVWEPDVRAVCTTGGLTTFSSVLDEPWVYVPHDVVVPGLLQAVDVADLAIAIAPRPLLITNPVDAANRLLTPKAAATELESAAAAYHQLDASDRFVVSDQTSVGEWLSQALSNTAAGRRP